MKSLALVAAAMLLAACHEIPQEATKSYAGKPDTQLYDGPAFNGDKVKFERALAARAQGQNEYIRMGDAPR